MWKWRITAWATTGFSRTCQAGALKTRLSGRSMQVCLKSANDQIFNLISKLPFWRNVVYRKQGPHSLIHLTLPMNRLLLSLYLSTCGRLVLRKANFVSRNIGPKYIILLPYCHPCIQFCFDSSHSFKIKWSVFQAKSSPMLFCVLMLLAGLAQLQRRRKREDKQDRAAHFLRVSWTSLPN